MGVPCGSHLPLLAIAAVHTRAISAPHGLEKPGAKLLARLLCVEYSPLQPKGSLSLPRLPARSIRHPVLTAAMSDIKIAEKPAVDIEKASIHSSQDSPAKRPVDVPALPSQAVAPVEQEQSGSRFYARFRPVILGLVAAVILGWWISSIVVTATRKRWIVQTVWAWFFLLSVLILLKPYYITDARYSPASSRSSSSRTRSLPSPSRPSGSRLSQSLSSRFRTASVSASAGSRSSALSSALPLASRCRREPPTVIVPSRFSALSCSRFASGSSPQRVARFHGA